MAKSRYKDRNPASLKAAVSDLIESCGGGPRAADVARVGKASLFRYTDESEDNANYHMPADVIRALETHCGQPIVTRFLAAEAGAVLLTLPREGGLDGDWSVRLAALAKDSSDIFAKFGEILADGMITPREAGEVIQEVDKAMAHLGQIRAVMRSIADQEGRGR
ncbi:phage regulatory CII family protein [Pelagibius sp.]|uniref:phage regulatory CII family protein n=1 Tax=Pelagibius sp. TaxID=1931238 RepID=UPI0026160909|nr:phage regulatory CII family protein [Pelagibius sp.]